jgi:hypothetical protein
MRELQVLGNVHLQMGAPGAARLENKNSGPRQTPPRFTSRQSSDGQKSRTRHLHTGAPPPGREPRRHPTLALKSHSPAPLFQPSRDHPPNAVTPIPAPE